MINIAICDDELIALEELQKQISTYMIQHQIDYAISKFFRGEHLLNSEQCFDIVFLDIRMDGLNGMETARKMRKDRKNSNLVFVTALKEYVYDAFDVDAVNYLIKPINNRKLNETLGKILNSLQSDCKRFISFRQGPAFRKILIDDILYCEVFNHTVYIHSKDITDKYKGGIEELEKELGSDFFRCHRSYILNLRFVHGYREGFATLSNNEKIPVAKRRVRQFMDSLLHHQRKEMR
ncbi:MAG: LytR/AlgR family response regulator transcription factor [Chitinophagales bacterium]